MPTLFEKLKRSQRFYRGKRKGWFFPPDMSHLTGGVMALGLYEPEVSKILPELLKEGDLFIDVGANVGYFSLLAADIIGTSGNVYAFEVEYENYYALTRNVSRYPTISSLNIGVSDNNSFVSLHRSSHSACHSIVKTNNHLNGHSYTVPTITLDHFWVDYLNRKPIQLIKIDVEGAEVKVLRGMKQLFSEGKIQNMIIEFCPSILLAAGFELKEYYDEIIPFFNITLIENEHTSMLNNRNIHTYSDLETVSKLLMKEPAATNINLLCDAKS